MDDGCQWQGQRVGEAAKEGSSLRQAPGVDHVDLFLTYFDVYVGRATGYFSPSFR